MVASWPASLPPLPNRQGFRRRPKSRILGFDTDVGPGKRRLRSSILIRLHDVPFTMTWAQRSAFETWFVATISSGVSSFTWVDPVTSTSTRWRFDKDAPYEIVPQGDIWLVTCKLEQIT